MFKNTRKIQCVISDFRHEVDENCALLGYYAASSGNSFLTFQDNLCERLSRNVSKELTLLAV
jgi:hypothetical protein